MICFGGYFTNVLKSDTTFVDVSKMSEFNSASAAGIVHVQLDDQDFSKFIYLFKLVDKISCFHLSFIFIYITGDIMCIINKQGWYFIDEIVEEIND